MVKFGGLPLKLGVFWRSGEWDDVADVGNASHELHSAFKAQPESGMGNGPVFSQIQVPPVGFFGKPCLPQAFQQDVSSLLPLAATDDLSYAGDQNVQIINNSRSGQHISKLGLSV